MLCPACNTLNSAMAVRCIQCNTLLIPEAEGRSPEVEALVHSMDSRVYGGVGFLAGFFIAGAITQKIGPALLFGFVGGALGRYIAKRKTKDGV